VTEAQRRAGQAVARALREGVLVRPAACERCGRPPKHALVGHHHNGYEPPHELDVRWLCRSCHATEHVPPGRTTGGRAGAAAYLTSTTAEQRTEIARRAALSVPREQRVTHARAAAAKSVALQSSERRAAAGRRGAAVVNARRRTT
jgi:hypothetical protein